MASCAHNYAYEYVYIFSPNLILVPGGPLQVAGPPRLVGPLQLASLRQLAGPLQLAGLSQLAGPLQLAGLRQLVGPPQLAGQLKLAGLLYQAGLSAGQAHHHLDNKLYCRIIIIKGSSYCSSLKTSNV